MNNKGVVRMTELEIIKWIVVIVIFFGVILPTVMMMRN